MASSGAALVQLQTNPGSSMSRYMYQNPITNSQQLQRQNQMRRAASTNLSQPRVYRPNNSFCPRKVVGSYIGGYGRL